MECRPLGKLLAVFMSLILLFGALPGSQPGAQAATTGLPGAGMACFRSLDTIKARLTELVNAYPDLAEIVDIGDSWEKTDVVGAASGSDLQVLRITNGAITVKKPVMFVVSGLDSRDILGVELNLRFAERLLESYGQDPNVTMVLDTSEVQLLIVSNPDGREELERDFADDPINLPTYKMVWGHNRNRSICTLGVDLTRNFYSFDVTPNPACADDYPGLHAESEPETKAIADYLRKLFPYSRENRKDPVDMSTSGLLINMSEWGTQHLVIYPYRSGGFIDDATTSGWIKYLTSKLANTPGEDDFLHEAKDDDTTRFGNLLDYAYGKLGVASLEMRILKLGLFGGFPNCTQFDDTVVDAWLDTLLKAARSTARPFEFAQGPEITSISGVGPLPFSQNWSIVGAVDARDYQNLLVGQLPSDPEGADYSMTLPPWHKPADNTSATYIPNTEIAHLGTFSTEFPFDPATAGEKQLLYYQAFNTDGKFGLPRAMFLTQTKFHFLALPLISVGE
jgi:carboxypeptidase T